MKYHLPKWIRWKEAWSVFGALALLGVLMIPEGCSWTSNGKTNSTAQSSSRDMALDFTAKNLDGQEVKLSSFKGKIVLVNFWAVWCGPCQEEIPELVSLYNTYRDKGFVIVGVSDPSEMNDIKSFVNEHKMDYPVVIDPGNISDQYNVVGFPTSFLIDRSGKIVQKYPGYSPSLRKRLEAQIQKLL